MAAAQTRKVGRPKGPRRDPIERRDELLDACVRAIRTLGPDLSMAELAAEAGVTRPILYDHFGDRTGIATALVQRYAGNLGTALAPVMARDAPFRELLREGIDVFCAFVDREPALWRFLQSDSSPSGEASIEFAVGRLVTDALGGALRRAGADASVAPVWAAAILGAVFLAAETWSTARPVPRSVLVDQLTALLVGGLRATGVDEIAGPFSPDR